MANERTPGSIRSPAANNGVYGLRPTSYRLPTGGMQHTMGGSEHIVGVVGPLSTTLGGIKLFMKTLIDAKPWLSEPSLVPFPWRDSLDHLGSSGRAKLKIGVLWDDGVVKPHPPVLRALRGTVDKLKGVAEIEFVDWKPYRHDQAWELIVSTPP